VINTAVGCHYFSPGLQLPSQPLRGLLPICCLVNRGIMGVNSLPRTVTRQRRGCDLNPRHSALESSTLTTRLPSHPISLVIHLLCTQTTSPTTTLPFCQYLCPCRVPRMRSGVFTARCYASAVLATGLCPSVGHKSVFYRNG